MKLRPLWWLMNRLESAAIRRLGTGVIGLVGRRTVLVLETIGRRTGRLRRTPVAYWRDRDGALYIGAGAGGVPRVDWVANLRACPAATVWVGRHGHPVCATELVGEAYERTREHALALWPEVARYERASGRRIPYFRLDPR